MPVHHGRDSTGEYYQWGSHGAKYRYRGNSPAARKRAHNRAARQGRAARANGYRG